MQANTIQRLLDINHLFYQNFAGPFARTRRRLQPGVMRVLESIPREANLVDLGCGNGELAVQLARRDQHGIYLGLDFSAGLLAAARSAVEPYAEAGFSPRFEPFDLTAPDALLEVTRGAQPVSRVVAFAVLHHIPGEELRLKLLSAVAAVLRVSRIPRACLEFSVWQYFNSPRLAARQVPWEQAGIDPAAVDMGDTLIDWRHEGSGLRYVHIFTPAELDGLAQKTGFQVVETGCSDGEGGKLGLYQRWALA